MKVKSLALIVLTGMLLMGAPSLAQAQTEGEGQAYTVQADDWLSKLADKFYGDPLTYPAIVEATNAKAAEDTTFTRIDNPDLIEIGQTVWIPNSPTGATATVAEPTPAGSATEAVAETVDSSLPASYVLPGESVFPEGVAYNPASGKFYVGSTTDGTLYEGDLASGEVNVFSAGGADGRTTAIGMKVDPNGNLWIAGGGTGQIFVYNTADGSLAARYTTPAVEQTFLNDVTLTPDSSAYVTDSFRPILFKVSGLAGGEAEPWLDFTGTVLQYGEGFNLNGIAATPDGRYLLTIHSASGNLFRIDTASKEVSQVNTGGADLTAGDGILLIGDTLYISRNRVGQIVPVTMSADYSQGTAGQPLTDPSLMYPTTLAQADGSLLVVNSQFNNREGTPVLPFTVSRIPLPQ